MFRCFADSTNNPCLTLAHKISATWPCRDLCRPIPFRQMRQKKDTQSQQCRFTSRFIRQTSASRWRADSHADLFTVEHLVARHHSGSCRFVWTRMPARSFAKVHLHLVDVHRCVVCTRTTEVETIRRCRLSSLFVFRISPNYPKWLTTGSMSGQKLQQWPPASFQKQQTCQSVSTW